MNRKPVSTIIGTACLLFSCITGCATMAAKDNAPTDLMIFDRWGGKFPVVPRAGVKFIRAGDQQIPVAVARWLFEQYAGPIPGEAFGLLV
jgi:hypothetical protein